MGDNNRIRQQRQSRLILANHKKARLELTRSNPGQSSGEVRPKPVVDNITKARQGQYEETRDRLCTVHHVFRLHSV